MIADPISRFLEERERRNERGRTFAQRRQERFAQNANASDIAAFQAQLEAMGGEPAPAMPGQSRSFARKRWEELSGLLNAAGVGPRQGNLPDVPQDPVRDVASMFWPKVAEVKASTKEAGDKTEADLSKRIDAVVVALAGLTSLAEDLGKEQAKIRDEITDAKNDILAVKTQVLDVSNRVDSLERWRPSVDAQLKQCVFRRDVTSDDGSIDIMETGSHGLDLAVSVEPGGDQGGFSGYVVYKGNRVSAGSNTGSKPYLRVNLRTGAMSYVDAVGSDTDENEYFYLSETYGDARLPLD